MIGVVADDITGANDIGIMFAKHHYKTVVASLENLEDTYDTDVLVIDTDSRLTDAQTVYARSRRAVNILNKMGCTMFIGKVCSVFRGHVGRLFDAILDEIDSDFAPVILGFPKNGRTTLKGTHYVRGTLLEESEFRHDPVHPMHDSNLVQILGRQTNRHVGLITYETLDKGMQATAAKLQELRKSCNYVIFDVRHQEDLQHIAGVVASERILCGSSAIAEELPAVLGEKPPREHDGLSVVQQSPGILVLCGSLMPQSKRQIETARKSDIPCFELCTTDILQEDEHSERTIQQLTDKVTSLLQADATVLVHASNSDAQVAATKKLGVTLGLSEVETNKRVSKALATLAKQVYDKSTVRRIIVAGGDTSGTICRTLSVNSVEVIEEIAPGLPLSVSLGESPVAVVLKSGSFGTDEFFLDAIHKLRQSEPSPRIVQ